MLLNTLMTNMLDIKLSYIYEPTCQRMSAVLFFTILARMALKIMSYSFLCTTVGLSLLVFSWE